MRIDLPLLRTSERTSYKRCPWQWYQSYERGLTPVNPKQDARWFGTGIHLCKAEWYIPGRKRGRDMHDTWDEYAKDTFTAIQAQGLVDDEWTKEHIDANELAHAMIDGHLSMYGHDENWEVISAEQRFSVLIPDPRPENKGKAVCRYIGTIDLIIRELDTGEVWLDDTKTASRIYTHHLTLLEQPTAYVAVGTHTLREQGLIGDDERVRGIIFDFMRKGMPDNRPINADGLRCNKPIKKHYADALGHYPGFNDKWTLVQMEQFAANNNVTVYGDVSKDQGAPLFLREKIEKTPKECARQIRRIGEESLHMQAIREGTLPILKTPQDNCNWCDYFELCELDESGGDTAYFEEGAFKRHDPYGDHRDGAENSKTSVKNKVMTGVK